MIALVAALVIATCPCDSAKIVKPTQFQKGYVAGKKSVVCPRLESNYWVAPYDKGFQAGKMQAPTCPKGMATWKKVVLVGAVGGAAYWIGHENGERNYYFTTTVVTSPKKKPGRK